MSLPVYEPSRSLKAKIGRRVTQWRAAAPAWIAAGDRPILSVTFDDFPASAARHGLPILADADVKATFYACAGLTERDSIFGPMFAPKDLHAVLAAGHEVGCHSFSHLDCAKAPVDAVDEECRRNADGLAALGLNAAPVHFAYPYGEATFPLKQRLQQRFATARGIMAGLNLNRVDALQLRAVRFYGEDAHKEVQPWLDRAARRNGWLILFTHDVAPAPSRFGTTPQALAAVLRRAAAQGFAVLPVGQAAQRLLFQAPAA